jgi:hypothetical protein
MIRIRGLFALAAVLTGALLLAAPSTARANFTIRATDVLSGGGVNASVTDAGASAPDGSGSLVFNHTVGNFSITLVTNIVTTGPGFTAASQTLNITYNGPTAANSDKLIVEIASDGLQNPVSPAISFITSNGSPSTSGLTASSVVMTSGVINGNAALGAPGTTLGSVGTATGSGTMGSASSVLSPNPATGPDFVLPGNPFTFYQTYTINGFTNSAQSGSLSGGSTVQATPAPAGLVLALTAMPVLGLCGWLRRRTTVKGEIACV